jgi:hypothetical protein
VAFLSKPAAKPIGFLNVNPKRFRSKTGLSIEYSLLNKNFEKGILRIYFKELVAK